MIWAQLNPRYPNPLYKLPPLLTLALIIMVATANLRNQTWTKKVALNHKVVFSSFFHSPSSLFFLGDDNELVISLFSLFSGRSYKSFTMALPFVSCHFLMVFISFRLFFPWFAHWNRFQASTDILWSISYQIAQSLKHCSRYQPIFKTWANILQHYPVLSMQYIW